VVQLCTWQAQEQARLPTLSQELRESALPHTGGAVALTLGIASRCAGLLLLTVMVSETFVYADGTAGSGVRGC